MGGVHELLSSGLSRCSLALAGTLLQSHSSVVLAAHFRSWRAEKCHRVPGTMKQDFFYSFAFVLLSLRYPIHDENVNNNNNYSYYFSSLGEISVDKQPSTCSQGSGKMGVKPSTWLPFCLIFIMIPLWQCIPVGISQEMSRDWCSAFNFSLCCLLLVNVVLFYFF